MNLVIVESPTKAKTIARFLGGEFTVKSSYGHVRDLPKSKLGVDVANNFEPQYVVPLLARKRLTEIKKALPKAKRIILATDEDREGEAIAWHLTEALKVKPKDTERIVFHEITKKAIDEALAHPRTLDMNLVDAQQARRVLDRLVGYELSPFLWRKIAKGLSAGRVQSIAVRLIVEREREIQNFKPDEYWSIEALLKKQIANSKSPASPELQPASTNRRRGERGEQIENEEFTASLIKKNDELIPKLGVKNQSEAENIVADLESANYKVLAIEEKDQQRHPAPPFVTSTLQQDAANKLHFSAKQTMQIAQQLYEGIELGSAGLVGLITYMRTDSTNLAAEAVGEMRKYITENFGQKYLPDTQKIYATKSKGAQEAHEAVRPTDIWQEPEKIKNYLTPQQFKLYNLIWKRSLACQMMPAVMSMLAVDVEAKSPLAPPFKKGGMGGIYVFRANGNQIKFDGFLKIYNGKIQEVILPPLKTGEALELNKLIPSQHFTQPPARYSEASLIKILEKNGIGRPSTYAPTISTIQDRNYVQKDENRKFIPTEIGFKVNDILVEHFPKIVDLNFTALMEENLDKIAEGEAQWVPIIKEFYEPFKKNLTEKYEEVKEQKTEPEPTDRTCPKCGKPLVIRTSRFGKFYACSDFPKCRFTENIAEGVGVTCPKCIEGDIIVKRTKRGKIFYACSRWPKCDYALWDKPTGEKCPECGSLLIAKKGGQITCSNKECSSFKKNRPRFEKTEADGD